MRNRFRILNNSRLSCMISILFFATFYFLNVTGIFAQNMGHTSEPLIDMEEFKKRRMALLDSQVIF